MEVGVKEAKNNFSELLKRALAGEDVYITYHNQRKAQLIPVRQNKSGKKSQRGLGMFKGLMPPDWEEKWKEAKKETTDEIFAGLERKFGK